MVTSSIVSSQNSRRARGGLSHVSDRSASLLFAVLNSGDLFAVALSLTDQIFMYLSAKQNFNTWLFMIKLDCLSKKEGFVGFDNYAKTVPCFS